LSEDQIKTKEGELILKNLRPTDDVILLDERGR
jgi:23S rRNA pseudoU1915 N3-methylase RlmH